MMGGGRKRTRSHRGEVAREVQDKGASRQRKKETVGKQQRKGNDGRVKESACKPRKRNCEEENGKGKEEVRDRETGKEREKRECFKKRGKIVKEGRG